MGLVRGDALTGVLNRRGFDERLEQDLAEGAVALLIVDIDNFKTVNDLGGHDAGDRALCEVAAALVGVSNPELVGRLGGDEFGVLVPGAGEHEALFAAGLLRERLGRSRWARRSASGSPPVRPGRARPSSCARPTRRSTRPSGRGATASSPRRRCPSRSGASARASRRLSWRRLAALCGW